jgi:TolA-binding protein
VMLNKKVLALIILVLWAMPCMAEPEAPAAATKEPTIEPAKADMAAKVSAKADVAAKVSAKADVAAKVSAKADVAAKVSAKADVAKKVPAKAEPVAAEPAKVDVVAAAPATVEQKPAAPEKREPAKIHLAEPDEDTVDMVATAIEIERGRESLEQLEAQLRILQDSNKEIKEAHQRGGMLNRKTAKLAMHGIPDEVVSEGLKLKRFVTDKGLTFTVTAKNIPVLQLFEAMGKTAGVGMQIHTDVSRDDLLGRIWLDMVQVDIHTLLDIVAGTQGLGVSLDKDGIVVAPPTALTDKSIQTRLHEQAVEAYEKALIRYPSSREAPNAYMGIARFHMTSGPEMLALQNARRVIDQYPASTARSEALLMVAKCHERAKRYSDARGVYLRYLDQFPAANNAPGVMLRMASTWVSEGHSEQAKPIYEEVIRTYSDRKEGLMARMSLAECLAGQKRYEQAVAQLTLVESSGVKFGDPAKLRLMIAECRVRLGQFVPARNRLLKAMKYARSREMAEQAYYAMGDVFLAEGKPVSALEAYRGAMKQFPDGPRYDAAHLRICNVYLRMNLHLKVQQILNGLSRGGWATEDMRPIVLAMANYYLETGNSRQVIKLAMDRRWPHDPETDPEILILRGRAHLLGKSPRRARVLAITAARLTNDEMLKAQASALAGKCLLSMENPVLAAQAFGGRID